jgi:hypothetical protein
MSSPSLQKLKSLIGQRRQQAASSPFLGSIIPAPPRFMQIPNYPVPVRKDAVLYVHGGPKALPETEFVKLVNDAITSGVVSTPLCFHLTNAVSSGRWSERWRITIAFKNHEDAIFAAPLLRKLFVTVRGEQIPLHVTSLVYINTLYSRLGWLTDNVGA